MSYDPMRERKRKKRFIQELAVKLIVIILVVLVFSAEYGYRGNMKGIMDHLSEDLRSPRPGSILPIPALFSIFPIHKASLIRFLGVGILGWFVWFVTDWFDYVMKKNMRPGEEHGSAGFNLNYGQTEHDYVMSPKILLERSKKEILLEILKEGGNRNERHTDEQNKGRREGSALPDDKHKGCDGTEADHREQECAEGIDKPGQG